MPHDYSSRILMATIFESPGSCLMFCYFGFDKIIDPTLLSDGAKAGLHEDDIDEIFGKLVS